MHIVLFFTFDISLKDWENSGLLDREVKLYDKLSNTDCKFTFVTYGNISDSSVKNLPKNISILPMYEHIKYSNNKSLRFLKSFIIPFKLRKIINKPDIIKTNQLNGCWIPIIYKIIIRKKLIIRTGFDLYQFSRNQKKSTFKLILIYLMTQIGLLCADFYTVSSFSDKKYLSKRFISTNKIAVRPNWVDTNKTTDSSIKIKNRLLSVGRLEKQKNYEYLINALKSTDIGLDIVGDGSLREKLETLANDNKVDVRFLGKMPNSKLLVLYDKYMYFVSSSLYEGNPKVVLEAMSSGCIVLINKNRNVEEIIQHKKNGLFFSVQDDTFLDTFINWRKMEDDLKKMSIEAMETIQNNNSLDIIVKSEIKDYLQLVNEQ
jgi:glycosyltransferase involved in cell wall biosynthesis